MQHHFIHLFDSFLMSLLQCMYEPPQENTEVIFEIHDDPLEDRVACMASLMGLKKVGLIFAHPPREKGYQFSGYEILTSAEHQLECAQGKNSCTSPFFRCAHNFMIVFFTRSERYTFCYNKMYSR